MNEKRSDSLGTVRKQLQFVEDTGLVTLQEVEHFLLADIEVSQLRPLVDRGLITQTEAVNLLLDKLQTWLEQHGIDDSESRKYLEGPETFRSFETFLFPDD